MADSTPSFPPGAPDAPARPIVLVTGFDPFDGETVNPSWQAAQALHGLQVAGHAVVAAQLPTEFGRSLPVLESLLARHRPVLAVCCGQAGGRGAISLERVAINIQDARIADNAGARPVDEPVSADPQAPAAYFTSLPVKAMLRALQDAGIPAEVSQTAGTFVCNHVFYGLMHALHSRSDLHGVRGGFMHVPWLPGQGQPSLPLEAMTRGTRAALQCALERLRDGGADVRVAGGALH